MEDNMKIMYRIELFLIIIFFVVIPLFGQEVEIPFNYRKSNSFNNINIINIHFFKTGDVNITLNMKNTGNSSGEIKVLLEEKEFFIHDQKRVGKDRFYTIDVGQLNIDSVGYYSLKVETIREKQLNSDEIKSIIINGIPAQDCIYEPIGGLDASTVQLDYELQTNQSIDGILSEIDIIGDNIPLGTKLIPIDFKSGEFGIVKDSNNQLFIYFQLSNSSEQNYELIGGCDQLMDIFSDSESVKVYKKQIDRISCNSVKFYIDIKKQNNAKILKSYYCYDNGQWQLFSKVKSHHFSNIKKITSCIKNTHELDINKKREMIVKNIWCRTYNEKWFELNKCQFKSPSLNKKERWDVIAEVKDSGFYLTTGGFENYDYKQHFKLVKPKSKRVPNINF